MPNPMIRIHNVETNEITDREMTDVEAAERAETEAKFLADEQDKVAKAKAKAALLERLGITEDEAKLLLA